MHALPLGLHSRLITPHRLQSHVSRVHVPAEIRYQTTMNIADNHSKSCASKETHERKMDFVNRELFLQMSQRTNVSKELVKLQLR